MHNTYYIHGHTDCVQVGHGSHLPARVWGLGLEGRRQARGRRAHHGALKGEGEKQ